MAKKHEKIFDGSATRTFEALRQAVVDRGFTIQRADGRSLTLAFQAKRSPMSSKVNVNAVVVPHGDGAKISMTGKDAGGALTTWGEDGKIATLVLERVAELLPTVAHPSATRTLAATTGGDAFIGELERPSGKGAMLGAAAAGAAGVATIDGTTNTSVAYDDAGNAHVEIHDHGDMDLGGESYDYSSDVAGDVDVGGGGFLDALGGLFG